MKRIGVISTTIFTILLAGAAGTVAQQDDKKQDNDREHRAQQQRQGQNREDQNRELQAQRPENRGGESARHQDQYRQQDQDRQQGGREQNQGHQGREQQQRAWQQQQETEWQRHRASSFDSEHRDWRKRGGYHGIRVPERKFRTKFGADHSFRVYGQPFGQYGGHPRFQYGGYWFNVMDQYPEYWGNSWYQTDDVYVDYNEGGYYLYNRRYPGRPGVAISISF